MDFKYEFKFKCVIYVLETLLLVKRKKMIFERSQKCLIEWRRLVQVIS